MVTLESDLSLDALVVVVLVPLWRLLRGMPIGYQKESGSLVD